MLDFAPVDKLLATSFGSKLAPNICLGSELKITFQLINDWSFGHDNDSISYGYISFAALHASGSGFGPALPMSLNNFILAGIGRIIRGAGQRPCNVLCPIGLRLLRSSTFHPTNNFRFSQPYSNTKAEETFRIRRTMQYAFGLRLLQWYTSYSAYIFRFSQPYCRYQSWRNISDRGKSLSGEEPYNMLSIIGLRFLR